MGFLPRLFSNIFSPITDQKPASLLIRQTAKREWILISIALLSSLLQAACEGLTLGVMFLAVAVLSKSTGNLNTSGNNNILDAFPQFGESLRGLTPFQGFSVLLGLAVVIKIIQGLAMLVGSITSGYFNNSVIRILTTQIHRHILSYTFSCASRYRIGDLQYITGIAPSAVINQINSINSLILTIFYLLTYLFVLLKLSPWLLLAAIVLGGVSTFVQQILLPRIGERAKQATILGTELSSRITENLQALRLLHTSGYLQEAAGEVDRQSRLVEINSRSQVRLGSVNGPITTVIPILMIAIIAWLSILNFGNKTSGILPSLVTFVIALQRLNNSIGGITGISLSLKANGANLKALNDFLYPHNKEFRRSSGQPYQGFKRQIELHNVDLRYASEADHALKNLNIIIPKGQTVALVGSSGAGKSSIADLLAGLYDPTSGEILIDGTNLQSFDLSSWQKRIGVVSQDTFLFNASIAANISFGTPTATQRDVENAAALAQAAGFIEKLPEGYHTLVGERGYRLSGGQRQRLSLARAILRNPDLLILDEATSALDTESERLVQEAIDQFDHEHTILVIAHRLSTIVNAHRIYVLEQGRVIEMGDHHQLIAKGGRYARLWQQQVKTNKVNPQLLGT